LRELEEVEISKGKALEVTVNSKEENSEDFLFGFRPRIRPQVIFCGCDAGVCVCVSPLFSGIKFVTDVKPAAQSIRHA
jgi:hypothetical protein